MNQSILVGTVKEKPTLKETGSGNRIGHFVIEVARPYKNAQGDNDIDIFQITVWNNLAEECVKNVIEGQAIAVRCRLQSNNYEREDVMHYRYELIADKISVVA